MPLIAEKGLAASCLPDIDIAIVIAGSDRTAIRRPGHREHRIDMICALVVGEKGRSGCSVIAIRVLGGLVRASRDDESAIRRPGQRVPSFLAMTAMVEHLASPVK